MRKFIDLELALVAKIENGVVLLMEQYSDSDLEVDELEATENFDKLTEPMFSLVLPDGFTVVTQEVSLNRILTIADYGSENCVHHTVSLERLVKVAGAKLVEIYKGDRGYDPYNIDQHALELKYVNQEDTVTNFVIGIKS